MKEKYDLEIFIFIKNNYFYCSATSPNDGGKKPSTEIAIIDQSSPAKASQPSPSKAIQSPEPSCSGSTKSVKANEKDSEKVNTFICFKYWKKQNNYNWAGSWIMNAIGKNNVITSS